jgi:hypothetical protein
VIGQNPTNTFPTITPTIPNADKTTAAMIMANPAGKPPSFMVHLLYFTIMVRMIQTINT